MAAEVVGHKQKAAWLERVLPPVEQVQPGLWSIPVAIPIAALRYVLVYVIEHDRGLAVVDSGWDNDESWRTLVDGLAVGGYCASDITDVLITHAHPDHIGLAGRIRRVTGARIAMHGEEARIVAESRADRAGYEIAGRALNRANAMPEEVIEALDRRERLWEDPFGDSQPDYLLADDEILDLAGWKMRGVWTPGHTPGHMCFVEADRNVMFTGDHVLPRITPNISVHPMNPPDALALYLESLGKVAEQSGALPGCTGLPGHEYRFADIPARAGEIAAHHEERLEEVRAIVARQPGVTTWDIAKGLTWSRSWDAFDAFQQRSALGEAAAHVDLLQQRGIVDPGTDAVRRWRLK